MHAKGWMTDWEQDQEQWKNFQSIRFQSADNKSFLLIQLCWKFHFSVSWIGFQLDGAMCSMCMHKEPESQKWYICPDFSVSFFLRNPLLIKLYLCYKCKLTILLYRNLVWIACWVVWKDFFCSSLWGFCVGSDGFKRNWVVWGSTEKW